MVLPAGLAQPAVAAPAGRQTNRPNGRIELELVAAFKKQSLLPPWIDSSCLWSDSTKTCIQFSGRRVAVSAAASWWGLLPPAAAAAAWYAAYRSLPASVAAVAAWRRQRVDLFFFPVAAGSSLFLAS